MAGSAGANSAREDESVLMNVSPVRNSEKLFRRSPSKKAVVDTFYTRKTFAGRGRILCETTFSDFLTGPTSNIGYPGRWFTRE